MTDKQIIIDGVDVSGCKHYKHNDENSGWSSCTSKDEEHIHAVNPLCCEKEDCLYKQLARKTQENEELKKQLEASAEWRIKAESLNEKLESRNTRYRKALEEIKGIAEENIRIADLEGLNGVYRRGLAKQILQKISEYEVNND